MGPSGGDIVEEPLLAREIGQSWESVNIAYAAALASYRIAPYTLEGGRASRKPEKKSEVKSLARDRKRDNSGSECEWRVRDADETDKSISLDLIYALSRDRRDRAHTIWRPAIPKICRTSWLDR